MNTYHFWGQQSVQMQAHAILYTQGTKACKWRPLAARIQQIFTSNIKILDRIETFERYLTQAAEVNNLEVIECGYRKVCAVEPLNRLYNYACLKEGRSHTHHIAVLNPDHLLLEAESHIFIVQHRK